MNIRIFSAAASILIAACGSSETPAPYATSRLLASTSASSSISKYGTTIQQLYVAYFGRPADPGGLQNFANVLTLADAPSTIQEVNAVYDQNPTVRQLVDAFGTSDESQALFKGQGTAGFVTAIYQNVLGRAPDTEGLTFWIKAIDQGGLTQGRAALSIMAGALANVTPQGRLDATAINNKISIAAHYTASLNTPELAAAYNGMDDAAAARDALAKVSSETDTFKYAIPVYPSHSVAGAKAISTTLNAPSFPKIRSAYAITKNTETSYLVTNVNDRTQSVVSAGAATLKFSDFTVSFGISDLAKTVSISDMRAIIGLFIAYYNRIPDADSLEYWLKQLKAGQTIEQIGQSYYKAALQYSATTGYSSSMSNIDFIRAVYQNIFGASELKLQDVDYWTGMLNAGTTTRSAVVQAMLTSAQKLKGDAQYGWVADLLDNKVKFANLFAVQQGLNYKTQAESILKASELSVAIAPQTTQRALQLLGTYDTKFDLSPRTWVKVSALTVPYPGSALATGVVRRTDGSNVYVFGGPEYSVVVSGLPTCSRTMLKAVGISVNGTLTDLSDSLGFSTAGVHQRKLIVADLNGDGRDDIFSAETGCDLEPWPGDKSQLFYSAGDSFVDVSDRLPQLNLYSHSAAIADLRNKGVNDLFMGVLDMSANPGLPNAYQGQNIHGTRVGSFILRNSGNGSLTYDNQSLPADIDHPTLPTSDGNGLRWFVSSEAVDLNGDGFPDLVLGAHQFMDGAAVVYFNDRNGGFRTTEYALPPGLFGKNSTITADIKALDLNGDGLKDLLLSETANVPYYEGGKLQVLINKGNGVFDDQTDKYLPNQRLSQRWIIWIHISDINNDGIPDLVLERDIIEDPTKNVFAYLGQTDGTFKEAPLSTLPSNLYGLHPLKINGKTMLVASQKIYGAVKVEVFEYK